MPRKRARLGKPGSLQQLATRRVNDSLSIGGQELRLRLYSTVAIVMCMLLMGLLKHTIDPESDNVELLNLVLFGVSCIAGLAASIGFCRLVTGIIKPKVALE